MKPFPIIIAIISLLTACADDSEVTPSRLGTLDKPIVKGYFLRDDIGYTHNTVGYPNVNLELRNDAGEVENFILVYPNGVLQPGLEEMGWISVHLNGNTIEPAVAWLVHADASMPENIYNGAYTKTAGGLPVFEDEVSGNLTTIDVSQLPRGFYRMYVAFDGNLLYDNVLLR